MNNKIVLDYEDFKFLMENLENVISEYAGAKEIAEVYIPFFNRLSTLLKDKED